MKARIKAVRLQTLLLLAVLVMAVLAIGITQAIAQSGGTQSAGDSKQTAESNGVSTQTLQSAHTNFAGVTASGALVSAQSLGATSARRLGVGTYEVLFDHNVRRCAYLATIGVPGSSSATPPSGEIGAVGRAGKTNGVFVQTRTSGGTLADRGFFLAVDCKS